MRRLSNKQPYDEAADVEEAFRDLGALKERLDTHRLETSLIPLLPQSICAIREVVSARGACGNGSTRGNRVEGFGQ